MEGKDNDASKGKVMMQEALLVMNIRSECVVQTNP